MSRTKEAIVASMMRKFDAQVLFDTTRAVLSGFVEGRGPDESTQDRYEVQHQALQVLLFRRDTAEADQLADRIDNLRGGIHGMHEGQRPTPSWPRRSRPGLGWRASWSPGRRPTASAATGARVVRGRR